MVPRYGQQQKQVNDYRYDHYFELSVLGSIGQKRGRLTCFFSIFDIVCCFPFNKSLRGFSVSIWGSIVVMIAQLQTLGQNTTGHSKATGPVVLCRLCHCILAKPNSEKLLLC